MSVNFWFDLLGIAVAFGLIIYFMPWLKSRGIRKTAAERLRVQISDRIKLLLPPLAATSVQVIGSSGEPLFDSSDLDRGAMALKSLLEEGSVLYSDERERVGRFLAQLNTAIPHYEAGDSISDVTEDLVLLGERIIEDLRENGLLAVIHH